MKKFSTLEKIFDARENYLLKRKFPTREKDIGKRKIEKQ